MENQIIVMTTIKYSHEVCKVPICSNQYKTCEYEDFNLVPIILINASIQDKEQIIPISLQLEGTHAANMSVIKAIQDGITTSQSNYTYIHVARLPLHLLSKNIW